MSVRILEGDCRTRLAEIPGCSVNTCVTSPPYFGLRDYGVDGQMGLESTPDEFVAGMVAVFAEVRRVLRDDGTLFLNIGDSYFGGGRGGGSEGSKQRTNKGALIASPKWSSVNGGSQRAGAYGRRGKAPEGSPERDCLCRNLCDGCRAAYLIGKSHSGHPLDPTRLSSSCASSPAHMGLPSDHLPKSGLVRQDGRSLASTPDLALGAHPGASPPPGVLASTMTLSEQPLPASCSPTEIPACGCQLCGRSLLRSAPASADMEECICDSAPPSSADRNRGMDASGLAYPSCTTGALKPKDLIGIPWMLAFALRADGWYLRQDIIWSKPNPMPESIRDRCTKSHEYIFLLSKGPRYFYDLDAVAEPISAASIARLSQDIESQAGSDRVPGKTNGAMKAVSRASGNKERKPGSARGCPEGSGSNVCGSVPWEGTTRNKRSVWTVATQPFSEAHFATFPPALIEPCILAGCPVGGTVLDPFFGAGTTGLVADRLQRDCIGIELNPEYAEIARKRLSKDGGMFAEVLAA